MAAQLPPPLVLTYIYLFRMIAVRNLLNSSNDEATDLFDRNKAKNAHMISIKLIRNQSSLKSAYFTEVIQL